MILINLILLLINVWIITNFWIIIDFIEISSILDNNNIYLVSCEEGTIFSINY